MVVENFTGTKKLAENSIKNKKYDFILYGLKLKF